MGDEKPLFIPLKREYFEAFEAGTKDTEYRRHPPKEFWVNLHPYCLHLYEIQDSYLTAIWEQDGRAARQFGVQGPDWAKGSR